MTARLLEGAPIARQIRQELHDRVADFTRQAGRPPGLGIVLVGDDPASAIYVQSKLKAAKETGLRADFHHLPATASLAEVLSTVQHLNLSDVHDGILVQDPLPPAIASGTRAIFDTIAPEKDIDAFHPINVGRLSQGRAVFAACTPSGIIEMLVRSGIGLEGSRAVVIGRSDIVGKPMALLLLHRDATVTMCHSKTRDLPRVAAEADILVAAVGRPGFVRKSFVKPGATVVDVGINRITDRATALELLGPSSPRLGILEKRGSLVVGDVHPEVADVAGALTPVPGGVGPLTIAMLLKNTLLAGEARLRAPSGTVV
ncbi:MAG TPA: bifunctional 5,10-methylenetetrahydrofolate dehydrogenase/5,10-methenyltetrahydrofolate cyclohydrolase [Vicinamibacterales bacterium]|jgi:methylenetetrahydrofolate dehydrogenase (NADP+)/methenyltetrahydrofolate cyclohydrolase